MAELLMETSVHANEVESNHLTRRGIGAARGGQKRIAAGLLTRAVQLNPRNEQAWLWLSGVIDDPHQVAFCLRSVLNLNPANERAKKGLKWLDDQRKLSGPPVAPMPMSERDMPTVEPAERRAAREQGENWWVMHRTLQRDKHRVGLAMWIPPVLVLVIAIFLNYQMQNALDGQQAAENAIRATNITNAMTQPRVMPVLESEPFAVRQSRTIAYFHGMEPLRERLRNAINEYRSVTMTSQGGGAAVSHVTAAQKLRVTVEQALGEMQQMQPPVTLQAAHSEYMHGLETELSGIDDLLSFYSSYRVELANSAALRFQRANVSLAHARASFDNEALVMRMDSLASMHTPR